MVQLLGISNNISSLIISWLSYPHFTLLVCILFCILLIGIGILYWCIPFMKYSVDVLKYSIFFCLGLLTLFAKYYGKVTDMNLLMLLIIFTYSWLYMKVIAKAEYSAVKNNKGPSKLVFKDMNKPDFISDKMNYYVTNTVEFCFTYNEKESQYTAIPMSEISSITVNGLYKSP